MSENMRLSICMMVKDEEKNLKRCLDALLPLLEKPDVELIIVDTGSTDQTVSIATRYTSKVYFHPWNNHFSDMRNITISYAAGARILILDADEVLLDAGELYELVSDVRLQSYNTFVLKIKNFIGANRDYTLLPQERVFRNDGEFRYEGTVHNQPKFKQPILATGVYIDHYGYVSNDRELQEKKFKRTGTILREELRKNPNSIYYRYQMAKSFDAHRDHREALEEIRLAYRLIVNDKKNKMYIFGSYALICLKNSEYEEAIKVCKEGITFEPEYIDLYYMMAESMQKLGRQQEALSVYEDYFALSQRYDTLNISSSRSIEMLFLSESSIDSALSFIIKEMFRQSRYDKAMEYAGHVRDEKVRTAFLFHSCLKLGRNDELQALYQEYSENKGINELLIALIEEERNSRGQSGKCDLDKLFSTSGDMYSLLNRIRLNEEKDLILLVEQIMKQADPNEIPDFYADMLLVLEQTPRDLFSCLKRLPKTKIKSFLRHLLDIGTTLNPIFETYLLEEVVRDNDFNSLRLYSGVAYSVLYREAGLLNKDAPVISDTNCKIFRSYVDYGIKYINLLYNADRLRLYFYTLDNSEDRFFLALNYAREAVAKGDYRSGIRYFGEAVKTNPYMACYMGIYKEELFKGLGNADNEEKNDE